MSHLALSNICKSYQGSDFAVRNFNLEIKGKEFVVFVGPSGCGKSTVLRMIAGLEEITSGELWVDGELMNYTDPRERNVSMVFQNYALYPNMNIYDNMAFSLAIRKVPKEEIKEKVTETAKMLGIESLLKRKPGQLSGGQKQRVAIGSAILRNPKVFLMDEPLSNLDAKMRAQMRMEIAGLYHKMDTTFIYVTHDQTEAMTLGTKIVVLKDGLIQQIDTPENLYLHPASKFVAGFIGSPSMNFVEVKIMGDGSAFQMEGSKEVIPLLPWQKQKLLNFGYAGKRVILGVRPQDLKLKEEVEKEIKNEKKDSLQTTVYSTPITVRTTVTELLGANQMVYFQLLGEKCTADVSAAYDIYADSEIQLCMNMEKIQMFDCLSEENIWSKGVSK